MTDPTTAARRQLAPTGVLRAGINLGNPLLVTGRAPDGSPTGVAPDLAAALAEAVGAPIRYVPFPTPSAVADAAGNGLWDIALIGAEPQRAAHIDFTEPYVEIDATYLVPAGSPISRLDEVDAPGARIAVTGGAAYCLWLERNLRHATLVRAESLPAAVDLFERDGLEVLAGLRTALLADLGRFPGARVLDGRFAAVHQAIGVPRGNAAALALVGDFVAGAIASGLIAELIARHGVSGLSAPAGS